MKLKLASYLKQDSPLEVKTIRAPEELWDRVEALAETLGVSVNALVVAAIKKACDEEGK